MISLPRPCTPVVGGEGGDAPGEHRWTLSPGELQQLAAWWLVGSCLLLAMSQSRMF